MAILCYLQGGLGNQMFQYAAATSLGERLNQPVFFDVRHYAHHHVNETPRQCELHLWNIHLNLADDAMLDSFSKMLHHNWAMRLVMKLGFVEKIWKPGEHLESIPSSAQWVYLRGYYQNENYFLSSRDRLLKAFTPKIADFAIADIGTSPRIAVHVRRGDYVSLPAANAHHGVPPVSYYLSAINEMRRRYPDATFLVFSDDIGWCQNEFKGIEKVVWIDENFGNNARQIYCMSQCDHHIISNSSFSWWGAWLNQSGNGQVIAPARWTMHQQEKNNKIVPPNWEQW